MHLPKYEPNLSACPSRRYIGHRPYSQPWPSHSQRNIILPFPKFEASDLSLIINLPYTSLKKSRTKFYLRARNVPATFVGEVHWLWVTPVGGGKTATNYISTVKCSHRYQLSRLLSYEISWKVFKEIPYLFIYSIMAAKFVVAAALIAMCSCTPVILSGKTHFNITLKAPVKYKFYQ